MNGDRHSRCLIICIPNPKNPMNVITLDLLEEILSALRRSLISTSLRLTT